MYTMKVADVANLFVAGVPKSFLSFKFHIKFILLFLLEQFISSSVKIFLNVFHGE